MTLRLLLTSTVITLFFNILILNLIKKKKLELKYSIVWFAISFMMFFSVFFFDIIQKLASLMGVVSPINWIFFISILGLLFIILSLTVQISKLETKVRTLTQKKALSDRDCENSLSLMQNNIMVCLSNIQKSEK